VANAEAIYADPSAILKLYLHQPDSARMSAWRARVGGAIAVTHHGRVEIINAICLAAFRKYITVEAMRDALASLEEDFVAGRYAPADLLWRAALKRAADLSQKHTPTLGCRSLDVLHVASAMELDFKYFLTFDRRQQRLAHVAGLRLIRV
jgi:predicted nucleic acid-binding protein